LELRVETGKGGELVQIVSAPEGDRVAAKPSTLRNNEFGERQALLGLRERGYSPKVIFDAGAAVGRWTRMALEFWPDARYFLFEALEERKPELDRVAADTGAKLEVLIGGVGKEDGPLTMGITESLFDSSFAYAGSRSRQIECHRLDSLYRQGRVRKPDFLKMDVQGFELKVLEGAREVLSDCGVVLMECQFFRFCESMNTLDRTIAVMSSYGFVPYEFVDFLRRPLDGAMGQCDLIFVRRGHWLLSDNRWA
jgi:FkbM family methyltransferase